LRAEKAIYDRAAHVVSKVDHMNALLDARSAELPEGTQGLGFGFGYDFMTTGVRARIAATAAGTLSPLAPRVWMRTASLLSTGSAGRGRGSPPPLAAGGEGNPFIELMADPKVCRRAPPPPPAALASHHGVRPRTAS
jgi:hypothetical protein